MPELRQVGGEHAVGSAEALEVARAAWGMARRVRFERKSRRPTDGRTLWFVRVFEVVA
jgi:hypothetical protein